MLTQDEVIQLILYLVIATALLLASRARAEIPTIGKTPVHARTHISVAPATDDSRMPV
jgi:hypothetical protein